MRTGAHMDACSYTTQDPEEADWKVEKLLLELLFADLARFDRETREIFWWT